MFTSIWRNKYLTTGASSIGEMARSLEDAAAELRQMARDGVTLEPDGGVEDDHATLVTADPEVAAKYQFDQEEEFDEFEEEEDAVEF